MATVFTMVLDNTNPNSLATRLRSKRSVHLRRLVEQAIAETGRCTVIDLGGTANFWRRLDWFPALRDRMEVTLVNTEGDENVEDTVFRSVRGDATDGALFTGQRFDICHSNSVIEHVGNLEKKKAFAANTARFGRAYVVQTPSYWFPVEPHLFCPFIHWLPRPMQVFLLTRFALGWSQRPNTYEEAIERLEGIDLLTGRLVRHLFPEATVVRERVLLLTKSFIAVRAFTATPMP